MNENSRIAVAELVGTMFLVVGGCGTAVFAADKVGYFGVATAFGLSLLVMAYTIGPVSGCHVNPAVTLGLVIAGKVEAAKLPYYWAGQVVGGLLGGLLLFIVFQPNDSLKRGGFATNGYGAHSPGGFPLISVIVIEVLMTALLLFVVLGTTHAKFPAAAGGLAVGGALWLIHLISIPISNTSVNPARSLGVAPFADGSFAFEQLWAFILFPLVGGAIGAVIWKFVVGADANAESAIA